MAAQPPFPPAFAVLLPRGASPWNGIPSPCPPPRRGSPQEALLRAAFDGNLRRVKRMARALDKGEGRLAEKVGAVRDCNGFGPLHVAAGSGRLAVCRYLVEELRLDVNAVDPIMGETPLTFSIKGGSLDVMQYLLDHGADSEKLTAMALLLSCLLRNCEIIEGLLSKGACVNALTHAGTALHFAAARNRDDIVKILLEHHADPNKISWGVFSPLMAAIYGSSLKCVNLLIEAGADVQGSGTETPLVLAAIDGLTDILKCLVQAGADPNVRDCVGRTPIETAACNNRREDVEILFPVTTCVPSVHDWSVDGIISYATSMPTLEDEDICKLRCANGKFQGREAFKNKDYLAAAQIYTMSLDVDPDDATLVANRSLRWLHLGEGKKALVDAQPCRSMRPGWSKACYREGAAQMLLKDYGKACDAFHEGLKLEPGNVEIKAALREAFESLKNSRSTENE
ncbi:hypothetical protein ACP70R_026989 [Stipagrostis hirtigluma subsp. patula]